MKKPFPKKPPIHRWCKETDNGQLLWIVEVRIGCVYMSYGIGKAIAVSTTLEDFALFFELTHPELLPPEATEE